MPSFGDLVRESRQRKRHPTGRRWTQGDLAAAVGVERNTVSGWENRGAIPRDPVVLKHVAEVLDLPLEQVLAAVQETRESTGEEGPGHQDVVDAVQDPLTGSSWVLQSATRAWLLRFLAELTEAGADEREVEWARRVLTTPANYVYAVGGAKQPMGEQEELGYMQGLSVGVRAILRRRGRDIRLRETPEVDEH